MFGALVLVLNLTDSLQMDPEVNTQVDLAFSVRHMVPSIVSSVIFVIAINLSNYLKFDTSLLLKLMVKIIIETQVSDGVFSLPIIR